jgi:hypothetical protein
MEPAADESSTDGEVITLIPTLQHIVMDLWVAEAENDRFAIIMKAVCSPVMRKEGSALPVLALHFLLHYTSDAIFIRQKATSKKSALVLLYVAIRPKTQTGLDNKMIRVD